MKETLMEFARSVPATGQLVYRVMRDDRVDERARTVMVAALGYAVLPFDLIPDRLPVIGKIDDVVVVAAALKGLFDAAGDEILHEHWDAGDGSLEALLSLVETVSGFLPKPARRLLRLGT
jgi:uncharacterized membrane protein YkvA (DUF1232 family)